jgi:hypothetical protein
MARAGIMSYLRWSYQHYSCGSCQDEFARDHKVVLDHKDAGYGRNLLYLMERRFLASIKRCLG